MAVNRLLITTLDGALTELSKLLCPCVCPFGTKLSRLHSLHLSASDSSWWHQNDFRMTSRRLQDEFRLTSGWPHVDFRMTQRTLTSIHRNQREEKESNQTSSYRRSLKYFVLFNNQFVQKVPNTPTHFYYSIIFGYKTVNNAAVL